MATSPERLPSYIKPGVTKFVELQDTPASYAGQAGKGIRIKTTEDGLEFLGGPLFSENITTPSRSLDTIYQNTTGKTLIVLISVYTYSDASSYVVVLGQVGSASPPDITLCQIGRSLAGARNFTGLLVLIVPPNWYYRTQKWVSGTASASILTWVEIY